MNANANVPLFTSNHLSATREFYCEYLGFEVFMENDMYLGLRFWGQTWTLVAWCELRDDFRNFRPDRMGSIETLEGSFPVEKDKELETFLARRRASDVM